MNNSEHVSAESERPSVLWMTELVFKIEQGPGAPVSASEGMELPVSLSRGMLVHRKQNTKLPSGIHPLLRSPGAPLLITTEQSETTAFTEREEGNNRGERNEGEVQDRERYF